MPPQNSGRGWMELQQVEVAFTSPRHEAVRKLDFSCQSGEFISIVGPSGCGKSTLLRLLAGLQRPTAGQVRLGWQTLAPARSAAQAQLPPLGFVFQQPQLLPWRNVLDNIGLPLELAGTRRIDRIPVARAARERVGLTSDDEKKLPRMLSGGMQMRVSVARALVVGPHVMLMDEPFAAVDDLLRLRLNDELLALWQLQRWTAVFVTHHVEEAVFLSQRVLIMSPAPGRITEQFAVPFDYPRPLSLRGTAEFAQLCQRVRQALGLEARHP